jgi:hypothetical protein
MGWYWTYDPISTANAAIEMRIDTKKNFW